MTTSTSQSLTSSSSAEGVRTETGLPSWMLPLSQPVGVFLHHDHSGTVLLEAGSRLLDHMVQRGGHQAVGAIDPAGRPRAITSGPIPYPGKASTRRAILAAGYSHTRVSSLPRPRTLAHGASGSPRTCQRLNLEWSVSKEEYSVTITVPREEVVRMLERAANEVGLGLRVFYELGRTDRLDDPSLRDMWLIWGDTLTEEDLPDVA